MGKIYDDWEKLVEAVVRRERLRELARYNSAASSTTSDGSSRFSFTSITSMKFNHHLSASPTNPKSFFLMAGATNFSISSGEVSETCLQHSTGDYYKFRDFEAVKLKSASWFDIRGKIKIAMLSNVTVYGAYMVYKLLSGDGGFTSRTRRPAKAMISYDNYESDAYDEARAQLVQIGLTVDGLRLRNDEWKEVQLGSFYIGNGDGLRLRNDEWKEVQLGSFYIGNGDFEEVQARLFADESIGDDVLKISGIEFRPMINVKVA